MKHRFICFAIVGGSATLIQFAFLTLFIELNLLSEIPASALSFIISAIFNYMMNYHVTFNSKVPHTEALPKFLGTVTLGFLLNISLFSLFIMVAHYLIAQSGATLITLCTNFLLHKYWIYRSPK